VLVEFLITALLIELTPGPNMAYLALLSANQGRLAGLRAVAGVTAGLGFYALLAAAGLGTVVRDTPQLLALLRAAGVVYLLYLAFEAWAPQRENSPARSPTGWQSPFWRGFLTNVLNAKAAIFYTLLLPRFIDPGAGQIGAQALGLGAVQLTVATLVHLSIVLGASRAHAVVSGAQHHPLVRAGFALALVATALWLALP
jgi:threonine/homoserine/homoserine lactone efflux protein